MIICNNHGAMLTTIAIQPAFQCPTEPGHYLVIDERVRYLTCEAVFLPAGRFSHFQVIGQPQERFDGTDVLAYAKLHPAAQTVQKLFTDPPEPGPGPAPVLRPAAPVIPIFPNQRA